MGTTYDMTPFVSAFNEQLKKQPKEKETASLDDTLKARGLATPSQIRELAKQYVGNLINAGAMTEADAAAKTREFEKNYMAQYGTAYKQVFDAYGIADYNAIGNFSKEPEPTGKEEKKAQNEFKPAEYAQTLGMAGAAGGGAFGLSKAWPYLINAAGSVGKAGLQVGSKVNLPLAIATAAAPYVLKNIGAFTGAPQGPAGTTAGRILHKPNQTKPVKEMTEEDWKNYYTSMGIGQQL